MPMPMPAAAAAAAACSFSAFFVIFLAGLGGDAAGTTAAAGTCGTSTAPHTPPNARATPSAPNARLAPAQFSFLCDTNASAANVRPHDPHDTRPVPSGRLCT